MAEWSNAVALKAIEVQASGGSNPSLSVIYDIIPMTYNSFVQSHFLKTLSTIGSIVFISLLLINPAMYTGLIQSTVQVNANFLYNWYDQDFYVINGDGTLEDNYPGTTDITTPLQSYEVQRGDSIEQIAQKYAVSIDQIKAVNNLIDNDLLAGQKLYVTNMKGFVYEVKEESISLMVFANLYGVDEEVLLRANAQSNAMVPYERGQAIFVPGLDLDDAYTLSLLVKPVPKPIPEKIVVNTAKKKPTTSISSNVPKKPSTINSINSYIGSSSNSIVSSWKFVFKEVNGMAAGQCTYYAAHKAKFAFPETSPGVRFRGFGGNANKWLGNAKAAGFKTSSKPSVGAIAVFQQGGSRYYSYGHVAIVEEVDHENNRMKVSDMNYSGLWVVTVRWIALTDDMTKTKSGQTLLGFIPSQWLPAGVQERYNAAKG